LSRVACCWFRKFIPIFCVEDLKTQPFDLGLVLDGSDTGYDRRVGGTQELCADPQDQGLRGFDGPLFEAFQSTLLKSFGEDLLLDGGFFDAADAKQSAHETSHDLIDLVLLEFESRQDLGGCPEDLPICGTRL